MAKNDSNQSNQDENNQSLNSDQSGSDKKNRPTPSRKEAESKNRKSAFAPANTKEEKAAARLEERERRQKLREAYMRGDESVLPARDKGPVRKFIRDYVDSRRMPGEYIFYLLFISIFLSAFSKARALQAIVVIIMYLAVIALIGHALILKRVIRKAVEEKFPGEPTKGLGMYAFLRSTQMRRLRAPAPQVTPSKGLFQFRK